MLGTKSLVFPAFGNETTATFIQPSCSSALRRPLVQSACPCYREQVFAWRRRSSWQVIGRAQLTSRRFSLPLICVVLSAICCACGSLPTLSQQGGSEGEILAATSLTTPEVSVSTAAPLAPTQTERGPSGDVLEVGGADVIAGMADAAIEGNAGVTVGDQPSKTSTTTATSVAETSQSTSSPSSSVTTSTSLSASSASSTSSQPSTSTTPITAPPTTSTTTTATPSSTSSGQNNFPDGTIVQLSNEQSSSFKAQLGGGSKPVLVWFWLPG